ncbi:isoleucyl-tRNA synthase [Ureaplasma diversum]|uniref:Isoleucine--tRNA ligase n=1 Tax=Ureaplasma diversum TaxID=42094 RepID=A0A0C5RPU8_9BACT|nr:isoleucine--tRNA ligase [Ureaplasma diversum]AJQ45389.1 isoleucyl-tRNA synthase [Ureaplasma diversum]
MDYKSTLNMPFTEFEMKANLNTKEPKIQQFWDDHKIYEQLLAKNKNYPTFVLHDGPPYANGSIHIGHALNKILKDIIVTYKNMNRFYAPFIAGWDTHGLPIEVALAKKTKLANDSVSKRRDQCKEYALEQIAIQKGQFQRLGLLTDFKTNYYTLDHQFEIDQLNLFKTLLEKGYIYQDFKPVFWSWSSQSALAESEIEYAERTSDAIFVKLMLKDDALFNNQNTSLVIWTTTPWTLPANLAVAINPNISYSLIKTDSSQLIIATDLVESFTKKVGIENYSIIKTLDPKELEKKAYISPINNQECFVILDDYVSSIDGTGLVHNAPGFGLEDYYACKKYGIDALVNIDNYGKYNSLVNDPELENMFYEDANPVIIQRLKAKDLIIHHEKITHSVAHDWRTKKPVMYRATKQWFVSVENALEAILKTLDNDVSSTNSKGIERMREMVINRKEWCISRQRVWGVPIPMIFDQDYNPINDLELVNHIINVLDQKGVNAWFELDVKEFLTEKYLNTNQTYYKEKDIMDVWFDSGSSYSILKHHNLNYPADLYLEGQDQYRGWFNSSIITGTILNNKAPYKFLLAHGMVLDGEGMKMSKSKGNVVDPLSVCNVYGADVLRIWIANSDYSSDIRISEDILKQNAEIYRRIRNTLFKYSLSVLADFDFKQHYTTNVRQEDLYVLKQFKDLMDQVKVAYETYNFMDVIRLFNKFVLELSSWYFENIKDDLYCLEINNVARRQIQSTVYFILKHSLIALTPIIPHTTEEAYSFLNADKLESVKLEEFLVDDDFKFSGDIDQMQAFFEIKDVVFNELEKARKQNLIKKNNEALVVLSKEMIKDTELANNTSLLKKWFNVAKVEFGDQLAVSNANFKKCLRCWNHYPDEEMYNDEVSKRCIEVMQKQK